MATLAPEIDLHEELLMHVVKASRDPLVFAEKFYPWGEGELAESKGPRTWQKNVLADIRDHLKNPATRYEPCQIAVASGKGIGKSALVSMIIDWAMSTCGDCKVVVTANTGVQLATKTQPEVAKWTRLSTNSFWWEVKATSITSRQRGHEREWRTDFIPWSKENMEAFSGLHNQGKRIVVIFDEASGIHDTIWGNVEGTLTDADTEMIWVAFGNPTKTGGRFRECFGKNKHRWVTRQIDARTVEGTNHAEQARQVADHGEDSYHVRIWIRGEFPNVGSDQFIAPALIDAARKASYDAVASLPKIMACDVARFGDDQSVIGYRQGRKLVTLEKLRGKDTAYVGERVIFWMEKENPDVVVIDCDGLGAGTYDHIKHRGFSDKLYEFHGGATPTDTNKYFNKRTEVWGELRDWIAVADIPDDPELGDDLVGPLYSYNAKGQICLEQKDDMKERGLSSPDCGDMAAMTFGVKIAPPSRPTPVRRPASAWG